MRNKYDIFIRYGLIPLALILSIFYLARGYSNALRPGGSCDLRARYHEQQYIIRGINPNYILEWKRGYYKAKDITSYPKLPLSPGGGGYPPWAYFTGLFLVPGLPWPATKIFFAILNAFSIGILAWFTYRVTKRYGRLPAIGLASAVLAMGSNSFALGNAQYGIIINAMISGMALCLSANLPILAGLLYGVSLVKPSISAPFFFILIAKRQWAAVAAAIAYIITSSIAISVITGTDPFTMFLQFLDVRRAGGVLGGSSSGPVNIAVYLGSSEMSALKIIAFIFLVTSFIVIWKFGESSLIVLLAIASVFGYLWTSHRSYDDVMMAFLLIALGDLALKESHLLSYVIFGIVTFTLWLPPSIASIPFVGYAKIIIWVLSMCYLLFKNRGTLETVGKNQKLVNNTI
ncbi:MAG: glycosyltransferase family 87 protein [Desulfobaccales bacterium]